MELNHKILGEGDPIIIMHGLFGMLDNWQSVAKLLSKDFMVVLLDLRNHGKSPHSDQWNPQLMASDVIAFMEDNWIHHATVLGHSMGGKVAMEIALTHSDLVERLIVVDIGPKKYKPGHELIFKGLNSVPIDDIQSRTEAEKALAETIDDWGIRQFLLKNISRKKEGGYQWKMNLPVIHENYPSILAAVREDEIYEGPALFIRGAESNYIMPEDYEQIRERFPESQILTIEGAGHWVHADKKEELVDAVTRFMKS